MISCRKAAALLLDFTRNELTLEQHRLVVTHLTSCPLCATQADVLQSVADLARELNATPLPPDIAERLWRHFRATLPPVRGREEPHGKTTGVD